jgi:regulator of protease activity HflC (stomatin/prohibitin superfamily)
MVDTRELCLTVPHGEGYTADNVSVRVAANIYVKFSNSEKAAYGASEPLRCIREFAKAAVRTAIGKMELNHIFENREKINEEVCVVMNSGVCEWGCHILRFEITSLEPADQAVKASLHKQAAAEREKTETILRAEAHREQIIRYADAKLYADQKGADAYELKFKLEGEGDKYRIMARAEAETESIKMISEALQAEGGENSRKTRLTEA